MDPGKDREMGSIPRFPSLSPQQSQRSSLADVPVVDEDAPQGRLGPGRTEDLFKALQSYWSNVVPARPIPRRQDRIWPCLEIPEGPTVSVEDFGAFTILRATEAHCGCTRVHFLPNGMSQTYRVPPYEYKRGCPNSTLQEAEPLVSGSNPEPHLKILLDPRVPEAERCGWVRRRAQEVTACLEPLVPDLLAVARPVRNTVPRSRWNLCYKCGRKEHRTTECQSLSTEKFCHVCGRKGFLAHECPETWNSHEAHENRRGRHGK